MKIRYIASMMNADPIETDDGPADLMMDLGEYGDQPYVAIRAMRGKDVLVNERLVFEARSNYEAFLSNFLQGFEPFRKHIFWASGSDNYKPFLENWFESIKKTGTEEYDV
jgi:hypothetical protein